MRLAEQERERPIHARMQVLRRLDGVAQGADRRDRDFDDVARSQRVLGRDDHTSTGQDHRAGRNRIVAKQIGDQFLDAPLDPPGRRGIVENDRAAAREKYIYCFLYLLLLLRRAGLYSFYFPLLI